MAEGPTRRDAIRLGMAGTLALSAPPGGATAALSEGVMADGDLAETFAHPPIAARPWVYWYFMDGHLSRDGMAADLDAMKQAGLGGGIFLEVGLGLPSGPVPFMSETWQGLVADAFRRSEALGLSMALAAGPGWCGTGGPWVKPEESMQHLVSSQIAVQGPGPVDTPLPRPAPRTPFFGMDTLTPALRRSWEDFYLDVAVLAFPALADGPSVPDVDEKALYFRGSFSSQILGPFAKRPWVRPYLPTAAHYPDVAANHGIAPDSVIDLTGRMDPSGRLRWDAPPGRWTILRMGRTATGQTTRPAPLPGLGFETDKFSQSALDHHYADYLQPLLSRIGRARRPGEGLTTLHFDSWEMGSQNWSERFAQEFAARRGYAITPFLPAFAGHVVGDRAATERFLWDVRQTAQDLVVAHQAQRLRQHAQAAGLALSIEPYDLNFTSDLRLGAIADVPMGEFWSDGYGIATEFSVVEATSIAHTTGRPIVGAESFTADPAELWHQHPASMKAQADWALCAGINRIVFHRFQAQAASPKPPGMTMGPHGGYGVHWDRTQTWWPMVGAFHDYLGRCQAMLRQGLFVADILYLAAEGAPHVFLPPESAFQPGGLRDRRGYDFDGCAPETLIERAEVRDHRIVMPDGMSYALLVLPRLETMTPRLLAKIAALLRAGAQVLGMPPLASPSRVDYPRCDTVVRTLADEIWGKTAGARSVAVGQGRLWRDFGQAVTDRPSSHPLERAQWLGPADDADPAGPALRRTIRIEDPATLDTAEMLVGASGPFAVIVNGVVAGTGKNPAVVRRIDIGAHLRAGDNEILVSMDRGGSARVIAGLRIVQADGRIDDQGSDGRWAARPDALRALAPFSAGLGGIDDRAIEAASLYPGYATAARLLAALGIPPDVESDRPLRSIHRRERGRDVYFVANRDAEAIEVEAMFRAQGDRIEWWDPLSGAIRPLPVSRRTGGQTAVPLRLAPHESGFVLFRAGRADQAGANFPDYRAIHMMDGPWQLSFDPDRGGPARTVFADLVDWSRHPDEAIRHYSGMATYRTTVRLAANASSAVRAVSLGRVANIATVRINGHDIGTAWCAPWRLTIPSGVLQDGDNVVEIVVANLWINRLIGDSGRPRETRISGTIDDLPFKPTDPLQPSGLLGPVTLLAS